MEHIVELPKLRKRVEVAVVHKIQPIEITNPIPAKLPSAVNSSDEGDIRDDCNTCRLSFYIGNL